MKNQIKIKKKSLIRQAFSESPTKKQQKALTLGNEPLYEQNIANIQKQINQIQSDGLMVLEANKRKRDALQTNMRYGNSHVPSSIKKFQIEDIFCDNRGTHGVMLGEQKKKQVQMKIANADKDLEQFDKNHSQTRTIYNEQDNFYYSKNNELISVKEFMFRMDALQNSKQLEGKQGDIKQKKQKIQMVQDKLQQQSIKAAQNQCLNGVKKQLLKQNIKITDQELSEMIEKMKFHFEPNLRLTNREADRQIISFNLGGQGVNERRNNNKIQQKLNMTYGNISKPHYFEVQYTKLMKNRVKQYEDEKKIQQETALNNSKFRYPNLESLGGTLSNLSQTTVSRIKDTEFIKKDPKLRPQTACVKTQRVQTNENQQNKKNRQSSTNIFSLQDKMFSQIFQDDNSSFEHIGGLENKKQGYPQSVNSLHSYIQNQEDEKESKIFSYQNLDKNSTRPSSAINKTSKYINLHSRAFTPKMKIRRQLLLT